MNGPMLRHSSSYIISRLLARFRAPFFAAVERARFFAAVFRPPFFAAALRALDERPPDDFRAPPFFALRLRGTFAPDSRASLNPIAIACSRLFTF